MGRQMSERAEFHVMGQPFDGAPLHYTASGLDYVYLLNGFKIEDDPDYGAITTIEDVDDLHRAIAFYILTQSRGLAGPEVRFLRKMMGYKQKDMANDLGVSEQTVANYEKGRKIPLLSERYFRVMCILFLTPPDARADIIKQLTEMAQHARAVRDVDEAKDAPRIDTAAAFYKPWQLCVGCHP
jgi:DNA-binding XRE family transcriptional regulator